MKNILLLHGAIGSKTQLEPLAEILKENFTVHLLNLPGHGGEDFPATGFSIATFADAVLRYMDNNSIETISIFGYSMGGYVAMLFAQEYPERVEKIITLATKFYWDEAVAAAEIRMLQPTVIEEKIPAFAKELEQRHFPVDWKEQLLQTQNLLINLGKKNELNLNDYKNIKTPSLIMLGDRDKMVTIKETIDVYENLPGSSLAILPQTNHPIEKADTLLLKFYINRFVMG